MKITLQKLSSPGMMKADRKNKALAKDVQMYLFRD